MGAQVRTIPLVPGYDEATSRGAGRLPNPRSQRRHSVGAGRETSTPEGRATLDVQWAAVRSSSPLLFIPNGLQHSLNGDVGGFECRALVYGGLFFPPV